MGLVGLARREFFQSASHDLAKTVGVERVERDADHPAGGDEAGADEMEQARPQLALRQIAGAADEHKHLRVLRSDAGRNSSQFAHPVC